MDRSLNQYTWMDNLGCRDLGELLPFDDDSAVEQCAMLYGHHCPDGTILAVVGLRVPNRSKSPGNSFRVCTVDVPTVEGLSVVGVAHTHPKGISSAVSSVDVLQLRGREPLVGLMYHPTSAKVKYYTGDGWIASADR
jgi:hypothetical protein